MSTNYQKVKIVYGNFLSVCIDKNRNAYQTVISVLPKLHYKGNSYTLPNEQIQKRVISTINDIQVSRSHSWAKNYNEDFIKNQLKERNCYFPTMSYLKECELTLPLNFSNLHNGYEDIYVSWSIKVLSTKNELKQDFLNVVHETNRYYLVRRVLPVDDKYVDTIRLGVMKPDEKLEVVELFNIQGQAVSLATALKNRVIEKQPTGNVQYVVKANTIKLNHGFYKNKEGNKENDLDLTIIEKAPKKVISKQTNLNVDSLENVYEITSPRKKVKKSNSLEITEMFK